MFSVYSKLRYNSNTEKVFSSSFNNRHICSSRDDQLEPNEGHLTL